MQTLAAPLSPRLSPAVQEKIALMFAEVAVDELRIQLLVDLLQEFLDDSYRARCRNARGARPHRVPGISGVTVPAGAGSQEDRDPDARSG